MMGLYEHNLPSAGSETLCRNIVRELGVKVRIYVESAVISCGVSAIVTGRFISSK
jgi:hypothetical protein